ncbi:uncharacterized protein LOC108000314 isoform X4 [Apis cerana]|uniref:uncharacterized protein LOC108000314 isoform X4 n=1 Tax=Apis cerana TaxID=7461 RepID=UPI002B22FB6E|nr:uncharacterized protein LOC108000314 isoform X4 [Apis cerana]
MFTLHQWQFRCARFARRDEDKEDECTDIIENENLAVQHPMDYWRTAGPPDFVQEKHKIPHHDPLSIFLFFKDWKKEEKQSSIAYKHIYTIRISSLSIHLIYLRREREKNFAREEKTQSK